MAAAKKQFKTITVEVEPNLLPYIGMLRVFAKAKGKVAKMNADTGYKKALEDLRKARESLENFLYADDDDDWDA